MSFSFVPKRLDNPEAFRVSCTSCVESSPVSEPFGVREGAPFQWLSVFNTPIVECGVKDARQTFQQVIAQSCSTSMLSALRSRLKLVRLVLTSDRFGRRLSANFP